MGKTLNMTLNEIYEHFPDGVPFPDAIPQEFIDEVDAARKPHYLWILPGGKVHCDACGFEFSEPSLHTINHKKMAVCPHCQSSLEARKSWLGQTSARRNVLSYHFAKSVSNPDAITCMVVYTCYGYQGGEAPWQTEPFRAIDGLYVFIAGMGSAYACPWKMYPRSFVVKNGRYVYKDVRHSPYDFEMIARNYLRIRGDIYNLSLKGYENSVFEYENKYAVFKAAKGTHFEYAVNAYSKVIPRKPEWEKLIMLMDRIAHYPVAMELVAKMGIANIVFDKVSRGLALNHVLNLRGKNIKKIFKGQLTKRDKKYLYEKGEKICLSTIENWQTLRKANQLAPLEVLESIDWRQELFNICIRLELDVQKVAKYLRRQREKYRFINEAGTYADYLKDCIDLSQRDGTANLYNLKDKSVLFPQNLENAHARTNELIRFENIQQGLAIFNGEKEKLAQKLADMEKKYKKIRPCLEKKYSYEAMGYVVVIPPALIDLHREGIEMHNCVAGYKERIVKGDTQVVYIRKKSAPERAFGTMEISLKENIIQARGYANKKLPAEAEMFLKKFEHDVLMPLRDAAGLTG